MDGEINEGNDGRERVREKCQGYCGRWTSAIFNNHASGLRGKEEEEKKVGEGGLVTW